jgi:hypothetical protein
MNRLRINHTPIFVTVLSACLGLVVTGAPTRVHQKASSVLSEIAAVTTANLSYSTSSNQALGLTALALGAQPRIPASYSEAIRPALLYRNANTSTACNRILVVTRLARASLDNPAAA